MNFLFEVGKAKNKDPCPKYMGQKPNFCDTTQIDDKKRPLAYVLTNAPRLVTDGENPSVNTRQ